MSSYLDRKAHLLTRHQAAIDRAATAAALGGAADLSRPAVSNRQDGSFLVDRCNPFGFATDRGAKHLMGGLFGPEHVGRIKWRCENRSDGRYMLTCRCGHDGPVTKLCLPHVRMINKRMAETCPRCVMPARAVALWAASQTATASLYQAARAGAPRQRIDELRAKVEGIAADMQAMVCAACLVPAVKPHPHADGIIHRCHCTPREIA